MEFHLASNSLLKEIFHSITTTEILLPTFASLFFIFCFQGRPSVKAPFAGYRSWFEPTFLVRLRFLTNAKGILTRGYEQYKNGMFYIRRIDGDTLVISNKYLEELRLLPNTILSNVHAQYQNILGHYTYASVVINSNLHTRALQSHLTPRTSFYTLRSKAELDQTFYDSLPQEKGWVEVDVQAVMRRFVARMTGAVFLGSRTSRNEEWLNLSIQYPLDTFQTAFSLRMFPQFTHPVLARLMPSRYRLQRHRRKATKIVTALMNEHRARAEAGEKSEETILDWMVDNATGAEATPAEMTSRQLILTLASIHTTALALSHALYDLCAHPEVVEPLREEIKEVTSRFEGDDFVTRGLPCLEKLDSFLVESQRFHPPVLMSPQRVAMKNITLHDGTFIPAGTRVACASGAILMDPAVTPNPEVFDPFRSYRKRQEPGEKHHHQWVQTDKENLANSS
ncbi:cytochrome P450 [Aaosphaeria arxii CBS 175.79]|uniref:Cytochrome P450 n=1 Tax=Aaosphaeria arxii CBS 175.79 TaxID=1450172 RepID=A0A6A5XGV7_9PLEO|nr:cytochrome P450 [Aaosphaeria arxii CBS 175.79]KAF2012099.1 cytochrome P450 [Aaosphaeria arxii CBS 175.79]